MAQFVIRGGQPISGTHRAAGNKNAVLPMLAACTLTDEPVVLTHVPLIEDVRTMLALLEQLGATVELRGHTVTVCARGIRKTVLNAELCRKVRSSILFAGPLTARLGRATLSPPGGDVIGRRRLDTHFEGLRQLGIGLEISDCYRFQRSRDSRGARLLLDEASVTATENILMAAVITPGETTLFNAACEPHVQDLCHMLNAMGAKISGIGTNYLRIVGVTRLGGTRCRVSSDHVEVISFIAAAALTGGELVVEDAPLDQLDVVARPLARLGIHWRIEGDCIIVPAKTGYSIQNDLGAAIPKIEDGPWPSFPSDLMSVAIVLATQAKGTMLFFEKMFESRMYFVDRLIEMGARIVQCDPHRVIVTGPAPLHGMHVSSPDIRAGMAMLLAALCAQGKSTIANAESIDRGYEHVDRDLRKLGADIRRIG